MAALRIILWTVSDTNNRRKKAVFSWRYVGRVNSLNCDYLVTVKTIRHINFEMSSSSFVFSHLSIVI